MNENERVPLSDDELGKIFDDSDFGVSQKIIEKVTPWKTAMFQILLGFGLSAVFVDIFPLNLIFPAVGSLIKLLGFRSLRKENRAFAFGYALSIIYFVFNYSILILEAAAIYNDVFQSTVFQVLRYGLLFVRIFEISAIVFGVEKVRKKAGEPKATKGRSLIILYCIILILGLFDYSGILGIAVIAAYVVMIVRLYKFSSSLKIAGFAIKSAKVKIGSGVFSAITAVSLVISIIVVNLFFGSYPMNFQKRTAESDKEVTSVKAELSSLGFPGDILDDLSSSVILGCKGAKKVVVKEESESLFGRTKKSGTEREEIKDIAFTSVAVLVSGDDIDIDSETDEAVRTSEEKYQTWKIIHHFRRLDDVKGGSTDCLELFPAYINYSSWHKTSDVTGELLFEKDGESFVGDYYSIGNEIPQSEVLIVKSTSYPLVYAEFSTPKGCENFRGYFSYDISGDINQELLNSVVTYYSGHSFPNYPAATAKDYALRRNKSLLGLFDGTVPRAVSQLLF